MTSRELAPMEAFQERVKNRLRDDIGELLPDEALAEMVQRVVEEEFFKKRTDRVGPTYSAKTIEKPTWFQELVVEAAKPVIEAKILQFLSDNRAEIDRQIKETIERGAMSLAVYTFDSVILGALRRQEWSIGALIDEQLQQRGLMK